MTIQHCMLCNRKVSAERQIGVGTLLLALATAGLWLVAIPLYEERCPICKGTQFDPAQDPSENYRGTRGRKVGYWLGSKLRAIFKH